MRREGSGPLRLARRGMAAETLEPTARGELKLAALRLPLVPFAKAWQALQQRQCSLISCRRHKCIDSEDLCSAVHLRDNAAT